MCFEALNSRYVMFSLKTTQLPVVDAYNKTPRKSSLKCRNIGDNLTNRSDNPTVQHVQGQ